MSIKREEYGIFPISQSQRNIWELERMYPHCPMNNICISIRIKERVDIVLASKCINHVLERNLSLRTRITAVNGIPYQYHIAYREEIFPFLDFSMTDEAGILRWEKAVAQERMSVCDSPLYQFFIYKAGENDGGILLKLHHLVADGFSSADLANQISLTCLAMMSGKEVPTGVSPGYEHHVLREKEYHASERYQGDREYWHGQITELLKNERAYLKKNNNINLSLAGERQSFRFSEHINQKIAGFCREHRAAPFSVYCLALAVHMNRVSNCDNICLGVPVMNRPEFVDKQTGGMYVSTLPFSFNIDTSLSALDCITNLTERWYDLLRRQRFPFADISALANQLSPGENRLFDIALSYQDSSIFQDDEVRSRFFAKWIYSGFQAEPLVIHLSSFEGENHFTVDYDYLTQIYTQEDIENLHKHIVKILAELLSCRQTPICELNLLDDEELEKVLYTFNMAGSGHTVPVPAIGELFAGLVKKMPNTAALICDGQKMTYNELYERVMHIAAHICLACRGKKEKENIVALCLPRGFDLVASMLAVSFSGNAWVILPPGLPKARFSYLLEDSGAAVLITLAKENHLLDAAAVTKIFLDGLAKTDQNYELPVPLNGDDLAYVVYTSGSTGMPKGVLIEQASLVNFVQGMASIYGNRGVLSFCNTGFDVFILESIAALLNGQTVILAREEQCNDPSALAELIQRYAVDFFAVTPSRLDAYITNPGFAKALGEMNVIVCGGEPLSGDLRYRLAALTNARLYNQYGPSETTIGVSLKCVSQGAALSIGKPMANCRLYVLDGHLNPLPVGAVGDLYIGGACVGRGYLNNEEATQKSFLTDKFISGQRMYRSGDIARWDKYGEIHLAGRCDSQVKLNGHRIEPQEIVVALLAHQAVEQAAVNIVKKENGGVIIAYYTAAATIAEEELYGICSTILPSYMLPHFFVWLETIPLTENGKTDFTKLPEPLPPAAGRNTDTKAETKVQQLILDIFQSVLERPDLTVDSSYFQNGGDSLNALAVLSEIERKTGIVISAADLRRLATPLRLAKKIDKNTNKAVVEIKPESRIQTTKREGYPLTAIQKSILFSSFSDASGIAYNMPGGFSPTFLLDAKRLEEAFCRLIDAEDILRTSFAFAGAEAVARVHDAVDFTLEEISAKSYEEACQVFVRPFDLAVPPLMRAGLWHGDGKQVLFLDIHHIINDGEGTPILFEKLDALYCGRKLSESGLSYQDYACYTLENRMRSKEIEYWRKKLSGFDKPLVLPTDFVRTEEFDCQGDAISFTMDSDLSNQVAQFCGNHNITAYTLFSAAYAILLAAVSEQSDLVIGTPVAGRVLPETRDMLGPFINTVPLRFFIEREQVVSHYLQVVSDDVMDMLDHADIDQETCISLAGMDRGCGHNGLYKVMFSMRPDYQKGFILDGQTMNYLPMKAGSAKMELVLEAVKSDRSYAFSFEYATSLFSEATAKLYGRSFMTVVADMIRHPGKKLDELETISLADQQMLFQLRAGGSVPHDNMTLDAMADAHALLHPDADAILFGDKRISYEEFCRRSDSIAAKLTDAGVKHGDVVGVYCDRTPELIYGVFGILKCGAAYLPLASQLPPERISQMLDVAGATVVLCDRKINDIDQEVYRVCLISYDYENFSPVSGRSTTDIAQVLFTSGSTGRPKGIMISYYALSSLLFNLRQIYESGGVKHGVLCSSNVLFDSFTIEAVIPLAAGISVVMADQEEVLNPWMLAGRIQKSDVQFMVSTPSRMKMLLGDDSFVKAIARLKVLILGGEAVSSTLAQKLCQASGGHIYNLYGPAEASVFVSGCRVTASEAPTIGHSMPNARLLILDEKMRPVIPTACGEIYIGGDCLAKGYIGRPDLTQAAFVDDPFMPGERLYRTGDMARVRSDGQIEFLGRKDHQVKLNGQRIELEEITGSMIHTGLVADAAVAMVKNPNEESGGVLCGFVVPQSEREFNEARLREALNDRLPRYMIPAKMMVVDKIPLTATGKINICELSEMAETIWKKTETNEGQITDAIPDLEKIDPNDREAVRKVLICMWKEVLATAEIDENKSFFEQGGTSLAAMNLLVQYFKYGWQIKLGTFYEKSTLHEQLDYICKAPEGILITGATGFLGAHIVNELISQGKTEIYCLVRGKKKRTYEVLEYYFGQKWLTEHQDKIIPVKGDISEPRLGLEGEKYQKLRKKIHTVYHCAADVRHYVDEKSSMRVNYDGTKQVIEFCQTNQMRLGYISTLSVAGEKISRENGSGYLGLQEIEFNEDCYDIGQNWQDNVYVRSKFMAEAEVKKAMGDGLNAIILRVGRLVGRTSDGRFQRNPEDNYFYNVITGIAKAQAVPSEIYEMPLELTPVDSCAKAAVLLINSQAEVAHLSNPNETTIGAVVETLIQNPGVNCCPVKLERLSFDTFTNRILEKLSKTPLKGAAILNSLLNMTHNCDVRIKVVCHNTNEELARKGFFWEKPDVATVLKDFVEKEVMNSL